MRAGLMMTLIAIAAVSLSPMGCRSHTLSPGEGFVDVSGGRIWYRIVGDGPGTPLLLLHGGPGVPSVYLKPLEALALVSTGERYKGVELNEPVEFVSSLAGGKTANVLFAGLKRGEVGIYEVHLELNSDLPTNPATQLTIAQDIYVSNIISFAVRNPKPTTP